MTKLLTYEQMIEACPIAGTVSTRTLIRWESLGQFPRRRRINYANVGWRESDLAEFQKDPEAWQARNRSVA